MKELTGAVFKDGRDDNIRTMQDRIRDLERELEAEHTRNVSISSGAQELRQILAPLYHALGLIFGQVEAMNLPGTATGIDPRKAAIWAEWKQKLPGHPAKFIDALLIHGSLTQTQLRIHAKCAAGSVPGVVSKLWQAGLINKNNGKISLKDI
jgi:hypothetical protein